VIDMTIFKGDICYNEIDVFRCFSNLIAENTNKK